MSNEINHDPQDSESIAAMAADAELANAADETFTRCSGHRYSYNFKWLGRPIIQFPQDIVAMQELIWLIKPDLIIETGIAHGGSLILSASILQSIGKPATVIGVDIDIREHNRRAIEEHPMAHRIEMIQGSSIDPEIADRVRACAERKETVMVILDSNHTHAHVAEELRLYSPLVTKGSYLIVFDTVIEKMPEDAFPDRPWGKGDNPMTAVHEFLGVTDRFEIDREVHGKLLLTVAPDGYLKCVS